jgi:hypothetical protein
MMCPARDVAGPVLPSIRELRSALPSSFRLAHLPDQAIGVLDAFIELPDADPLVATVRAVLGAIDPARV